jgi:hypothetical protein
MNILPVAECIYEMHVAAEMCHDPELDLRIVGRKYYSSRTAWYEGFSYLLASLCPDRNILQIRLG